MTRFFIIAFTLLTFFSCKQNNSSNEVDSKIEAAQLKVDEANKKLEIAQDELDALLEYKNQDKDIPQKVYDTYSYIKKYDEPRKGFVGGRSFMNREELLPKVDKNGGRIAYREWDVNPKKSGKNRGRERLVTGSDGSAYYTNNHYQSFTKIE